MNNSDLETSLSKMTLKPASTDYVSGAEAIFKNQQKRQVTPWWNKVLAASLLLSLATNFVQYQKSARQVADVANTQEAQMNAASGGYTVVQTDASPDGHHQSITVIWEKKS